ncbi:MAG: CheR family methyltransferase [Candidatus Sericytochromatia bacterium]
MLKRYTNMIVKEAENNEEIKDKHIYIAPSSFQMKVFGNRILLNKDNPLNYARPSIDYLFNSLIGYKNKLAVVIVSGYNDDGTFSLEKLKNNNVKIILQDPNECVQNEIIKTAIKKGFYDYIMPIPEIAHYIHRNIVRSDSEILIDEKDLSNFLKEVKTKYGYDYSEYSNENVSRMIKKEMRNSNNYDFKLFSKEILEKNVKFESLFLTLSINVTEFFRNPEVFYFLRKKVLNYIASLPSIKIWCAACSTGEEPYSIAIMLKEAGLLEKSQIYATDINPYIVEQAKNGFFSKEVFDKSLLTYKHSGGTSELKNYFTDLTNCYQIKDEIKDKILFFEHSLLSEGIINEFDVIFCRNVLIYFNNSLFKKTLDLLYNSLAFNGFLILGKSEDIINNNNFLVYNNMYKIYKKAF